MTCNEIEKQLKLWLIIDLKFAKYFKEFWKASIRKQ